MVQYKYLLKKIDVEPNESIPDVKGKIMKYLIIKKKKKIYEIWLIAIIMYHMIQLQIQKNDPTTNSLMTSPTNHPLDMDMDMDMDHQWRHQQITNWIWSGYGVDMDHQWLNNNNNDDTNPWGGAGCIDGMV